MTATAGSDVVQSGRPIFDDFFQHLWPYIGNNTANVVFQMVKHNVVKKVLQFEVTGIRERGRLMMRFSSVTENIKVSLQTQVLGPKPKYVPCVSQALGSLESLGSPVMRGYSRLDNAFRFVEWAQNEIAVVPDFHKRILFSNEAHFWLNGYVNKLRWSEANPQVYVETLLHPEKLTVWCALWAGGIIGPYFFKNDEGDNVTVNGDWYRAMITNFFIPELNNHDVHELWFQQDGATCHTARATIDLLKDTFGDRLISRFGPVNWPPRSCDLTPLDYFLWGYVKSLVYADKPQTLDHLEDNIRRVIADIRP
ncbi:putative transposable element [Trichonephila clavipes]|uniref:Putative transposable element n=1 Tax=Trichonephila clavipes TaxID=2585209 RepID=A0A8X6VY84_TRICX|nr:putative transposable element [Trichonephila clavipes]